MSKNFPLSDTMSSIVANVRWVSGGNRRTHSAPLSNAAHMRYILT